jgi:hypothetical protein
MTTGQVKITLTKGDTITLTTDEAFKTNGDKAPKIPPIPPCCA